VGQEPPSAVQATAAQTWVFGSQTPEAQSAGTKQERPFPHLLEQEPPQSTSVSVPFLTPSVQEGPEGVAQSFEALQKPELQSVGAAQPSPSAHVFPWATQVAPPQSTPVSLPFFTPSVHVGGVAGWVEVFPPPPPQPAIARAIVSASASRLKTGHAKLDMALPSVN
jgi:hypothetical protein